MLTSSYATNKHHEAGPAEANASRNAVAHRNLIAMAIPYLQQNIGLVLSNRSHLRFLFAFPVFDARIPNEA
jgi:hypothetical protein